MLDYLNSLPITDKKKAQCSGVALLAQEILETNAFWSAADISIHLDCTGKRAADYLDNMIKGKRYEVAVETKPRRVKVIAINRQSKVTKIKPELLVLAKAIREHGGFWSRKDIKVFLIKNGLINLYENHCYDNWPCEIAHGFYLRIIKNKNITTNELTNPPRVQVISII